MVSSAATQPKPVMITCSSGANTNWPKEPPALISPAAKDRRSAGSRCSTAPIRIEKLPAPAPNAVSTPSTRINWISVRTNGVSAMPAVSSSPPSTRMRPGPNRSASAPNTGCARPQLNWPIAAARLIATIPRPVAAFSGAMNRPIVWRAPIVIIRIAEAISSSSQ